jgi:hypothetical protein
MTFNSYLNTAESVGPKESLTLPCDVIPLPLEEVDHGGASGGIVRVPISQGQGQTRQDKNEANHPRRKSIETELALSLKHKSPFSVFTVY